MRLQLRTLMLRHHLVPQPVQLPLFDQSNHDLVVEGYASTDDVDGDRVKFRPYCFGWPLLFRNGYPPLYLKHDTAREVGRVDHCQYDDFGSVQIWATVTDAVAKRMPAFSIACVVHSYQIINPERPDFFGLITSAEITEVSLTDAPANPTCLVMDRNPVPPTVKSYELMRDKVACLQQLSTIIQKGVHHG